MINLLKVEGYNPGALLDCVIDQAKLRTDSALARAVGTGAPAICKIRGKHAQVTPDLLIRLHDLTGRSIDELRGIAGIPKTRLSVTKKEIHIEPGPIVDVGNATDPDVVEVGNV